MSQNLHGNEHFPRNNCAVFHMNFVICEEGLFFARLPKTQSKHVAIPWENTSICHICEFQPTQDLEPHIHCNPQLSLVPLPVLPIILSSTFLYLHISQQHLPAKRGGSLPNLRGFALLKTKNILFLPVTAGFMYGVFSVLSPQDCIQAPFLACCHEQGNAQAFVCLQFASSGFIAGGNQAYQM